MKRIIITASLLVTPLVASAAVFGGVRDLITSAQDLVRITTVLVVSLGLLTFFWGLVKFILKGGDAKEVENGRRLMIWGVVAMFVMISVWGLVTFIQRQLNIEGDLQNPTAPGINNSFYGWQ